MWPYFWILIMIGLIAATTVVGMREKKARQAAIKKMNPQPVGGEPSDSAGPLVGADDGFGESDPLESFGEAGQPEDEDAFK